MMPRFFCKWCIHNITFYSAEPEQAPSSALYVCMSITVRLPGKFFDVPARYYFVRNGVHIVSLTCHYGVCTSFH